MTFLECFFCGLSKIGHWLVVLSNSHFIKIVGYCFLYVYIALVGIICIGFIICIIYLGIVMYKDLVKYLKKHKRSIYITIGVILLVILGIYLLGQYFCHQ